MKPLNWWSIKLMKQPCPEYRMLDSTTKQLRTTLSKHCCEPGCLLLSQPMRGAPSDLNYRAGTDWLTAEETGSRPAESTERRAGVYVWGEFTAGGELVGGQNVENTVWNHKSSELHQKLSVGVEDSKVITRGRHSTNINTERHAATTCRIVFVHKAWACRGLQTHCFFLFVASLSTSGR